MSIRSRVYRVWYVFSLGTSCIEVVWMVGIFTCDVMGKSAYVKKKWASRNLISVDDFSIGKGQDSLIFGNSPESRFRA